MTTNLDVVDANDGVLSLREAIEQAETGSTITFAAKLKGETITLSGTQLEITKGLTVDASALYDATTQAPGVTVDANQKSRVFNVSGGTNDNPVALIGLKITGGNEAVSGGGVYATDTTTFTNCAISGNTATERGGGVYATDTTTFTNCAISGNEALSGGGVSSGSTTTLYNSIVALNIANDGADIFVLNNPQINAYNTLSSYSAWSGGTNNYVYNASLPLFTDAENGDYTLASGSQAIDKGDDQYAYDVGWTVDSRDLAGKRRFMGSAIDLGAYELPGVSASQRDVYVGDVELTWNEYDDATSGRVYWTSGAATTFIGTIAVGGTLLWDSTKFANGAGEIVCEYFDEKGVAVGKTASVGTIINDPGVVVKRGKIDANETWESDKVYVVVGPLEIAANAKLTVAPSTVVKFWKNGYLNLVTGAKLEAGAESVWTRAEDDSVGGDTNQDDGNSTPKYGGAYWRGSGVDGATIDASAVVKYVPTTCYGKLAQSETWLGGQVYRITGDLTVPSGVTLTIQPGAILKFDAGMSLIVEKGGKLTAQGTTAQPIVFTSINDDQYGGDTNGDDGETSPSSGDWNKILAQGVVEMNYAHIRGRSQ